MITYRLKIDVQGERERYEDIVFTTGDKRGYRLEFAFYSYGARLDVSGCALTVKTRRLDGAVVIDSGYVDGQTAYYDVADNAYEIPGEVKLETALIGADGSLVTVSVITAQVREGFGEAGLSSEENEPVLAKLEAAALTTQGAVNEVRSELDAHQTDAEAHAEALALERTRFNPLYANALKGSASGNNITVTDSVEGTPVELTLYGATTEVLTDPAAEKSPDNPATITGIGESGSVTVTAVKGKNLFDADTLYDRFCKQAISAGNSTNWFKDNVEFEGRNCVRNAQLGVTANTPLFVDGKPNTQYTFAFYQYADSDNLGAAYRIQYTDNTEKWVNATKTREWEKFTITTAAGKTVKAITQRQTASTPYVATYWDKSSMMLNEGATALPYEPYNGEDITVPLTSPLYKLDARPGFETLPNWSAKIDEVTGAKLIRRTVREEFDGTEEWYVNGEVKDGLIRYFLTGIYGLKIGGVKPIVCTHFNYDAVNGSSFYVENACAYYVFDTNTGRGWFGACVSVDRFPTVDDFKAWLAQQAAAGTPVGFVRPIDPVETDITDTEAGQALLALAAQNGTTYLNSEGADMEVRYNRDVNKAIEELQNAVAALNAAAVENI